MILDMAELAKRKAKRRGKRYLDLERVELLQERHVVILMSPRVERVSADQLL